MRLRRRPSWRIMSYLAGVVLLWRILASTVSPFLRVQLYHLQWHNHGLFYSLGLTSVLSKEPLIQIVNDHAVDIVFEMRHDPETFIKTSIAETPAMIYWYTDGDKTFAPSAASMSHYELDSYVFRARLSDSALVAATIHFHIELGSWQSKVYTTDLFGRSDAESVQIGVIGDNQFAAVQFTKILQHLTKVSSHALPDAFIHLGDAVQDAASARSWSTDFWSPLSAYSFLTRPWIMLRGNHDAPSVYTSAPRGKDQLGYTSFLIKATSTFIIILDSNTDSELQDRYLAATLRSDQAQMANRRIVLVHIPPFVEYWDPVPWHAGEKLWGIFVRNRWVPLFQQYHVDLVISGHQHNYQRGTKNGVTYIIAGGAGGTLDHQKVEDYALDNPLTIIEHHFGLLELDAQRGIHWKLYLEDGSLADEVLI